MKQTTNKIPNDTLAGQNTVERLVTPLPIVKQRFKGDCSVASLAMFLGITYEQIIKHYPTELDENFCDGVWNSKTFEVAAEYGVELTCLHDNYDLNIPSLLIVDSLNLEGRLHTIYWDGKKIFDPANGKCYMELPKNIAYIFQDYNAAG